MNYVQALGPFFEMILNQNYEDAFGPLGTPLSILSGKIYKHFCIPFSRKPIHIEDLLGGHPPAFKIYLQTARSLEFKDFNTFHDLSFLSSNSQYKI